MTAGEIWCLEKWPHWAGPCLHAWTYILSLMVCKLLAHAWPQWVQLPYVDSLDTHSQDGQPLALHVMAIQCSGGVGCNGSSGALVAFVAFVAFMAFTAFMAFMALIFFMVLMALVMAFMGCLALVLPLVSFMAILDWAAMAGAVAVG